MDIEEDHKDVLAKKREYPSELEIFLRRDIPDNHVIATLKSQGKTENEIEKVLEKLHKSRDILNKVVRRVVRKIDSKISMLDIPDRVKTGMKFAEKLELNDLEKEALRKQLLEKTSEGLRYTYIDDLKYTEMAKFLGFDQNSFALRHPFAKYYNAKGAIMDTQIANFGTKDFAKLQDLMVLFERARLLHADVKRQSYMYKSCSPEALCGTYEPDKYMPSIFIHPVIVALFLPKIKPIENRMLMANAAKIILSRSIPFLKDKKLNLNDNMFNESEYDLDFAYAIMYDPNSLDYFADEAGSTPFDNIVKRFKIQVELWKNVYNLRLGKYYGTSYDDTKSGILGFLQILNSFEWTYFDSPDMYTYQDEGTVLRKLLAVFSMRPTYVQLSTFGYSTPYGMRDIGDLGRSTFVDIPIINVKLPDPNHDSSAAQQEIISLGGSLNRTQWVMENNNFVPKHKTVFSSRDILFFHVNRRYTAFSNAMFNVGSNTICNEMKFHSPPSSMVSTVVTNNVRPINVEQVLAIGGKTLFTLQSVVLAQSVPSDANMLLGSSTIVHHRSGTGKYLYYNPQAAAYYKRDGDNNSGGCNDNVNRNVFTTLENSGDYGFDVLSRTRGTIYIYVVDGAVD